MKPSIPSLINTIVTRSSTDIISWKAASIFKANTYFAAFYVGGCTG